MLRLILLWLIRILAVAFSVINLTYLDIKGFSSIIFIIFGILSCLNLYAWGVFTRETNRKIPGLFILFRVLQGLLILTLHSMDLHYFVVYLLLDGIFFCLLMYDGRFQFILREPRDETKVKVRREQI